MSKAKQTSFLNPIDRSKEVIRRCSNQFGDEAETVNIAVSGGTDSVVAADIICRYGPEFGIEPDCVTHINTGASVPQSRLVAKIISDIHDLEYIEQGYRKENQSLAYRVLGNGWPGGYPGSPRAGGHGLEYANRKQLPMGEVYVTLDGVQIWVSGARKLESKARQGNVPDSGVSKDKPRRVWLSVIVGWTSEEKQQYIKDRGLPVSESYLILGFSGECTACSFDEPGLLTDLELLSPELAHCIRTLAVWLFMRVRRGDVDLEAKRLCWGWEPDEDTQVNPENYDTFDTQDIVGCDEESCSAKERKPWIMDLPDEQIVTRSDVVDYWNTKELPQRFPV